jgi:hypothetical protein
MKNVLSAIAISAILTTGLLTVLSASQTVLAAGGGGGCNHCGGGFGGNDKSGVQIHDSCD